MTEVRPTLYKFLNEDGSCYHGGKGKWHLPTNDKPARRTPRLKGKLIACKYGYHILEAQDLVYWLRPAVRGDEGGEDYQRHGHKGVTERARLVRRVTAW